MPLSEVSRLERRLSVVIAGSGYLESDRRLLIMQLLRFSARRCVKLASASGTSVNKLPDKSKDCKVSATGFRHSTDREVSPFSARLRCRRNRHFDGGRMPCVSKSVALCRGVMSCVLEFELPDDLRYTGALPLRGFCNEPCLELGGRTGELLRCRTCVGVLVPSDEPPLIIGLPKEPRRWSTMGELGVEYDRASSICRALGLFDGHGRPDVNGVVGNGALDDRFRLFSMSSSTTFNSRSIGSSTPARLTVRLRSCSDSLSQPWNCLKSRSHISSAPRFLNANRGTAVSNGNSSKPATSRARWSGASFKAGIFVKQEYRYLISSRNCTILFSSFAALFDSEKVDHRDDTLDITLRTLDTDFSESASDCLPLDFGAWPRNDM